MVDKESQIYWITDTTSMLTWKIEKRTGKVTVAQETHNNDPEHAGTDVTDVEELDGQCLVAVDDEKLLGEMFEV